MLQLPDSSEVYLLPGDMHFADNGTRMHTVLGSCVSISVWHPLLRIGGMSHSILPCRGRGKQERRYLDGNYICDAVEMLLLEVGKRDTSPGEYQVKLFGGGHMIRVESMKKNLNVGECNIEAAREFLMACGFSIHSEHVGGNGHRRIIFDLCDGSVLVKHSHG